MRHAFLCSVSSALVLASAAAAGQDFAARQERMPFDECLALIDEVAGEFGPDHLQLQRSRDVSSARIRVADGAVTLVCRRVEQTVTLSRSRG